MGRSVAAVMIALWLAVCAAAPAYSQDQDDKTLIVRTLESALSGAGRSVQIEGFRGALSSRATLDKLTIADDQGIWLTLTDAVLDWNRAALLGGRVEINEISAVQIDLPRLGQADTAVSPEAGDFALPTLPVSLRIDAITVDRVVLGDALIAGGLVASVRGALRLADGQGDAALDIQRLQGPRGAFALAAGFANDTRILSIDLALDEAAGGIAASAMALPGVPALELTLKGSAPIDDFAADLRLVSDGQQRLGGRITTQKPTEDPLIDRVIAADVAGDLTQLFAPQYRPFFGPWVALTSRITLFADGRTALEDLSLQAAALTLSGQALLDAGRMPDRFALQVDLADPTGAPVLLPLGGAETWVQGAQIRARFDRAQGDGWQVQAGLDDLRRDQTRLDRLDLTAAGTITAGDVPQVTARLDAQTQGLDLDRDALDQVLGPVVQIGADLMWRADEPLAISALDLQGRALRLTGAGTVDGLDSDGLISGSASVQIGDLARFSALAGRPLAGALVADLSGSGTLLSGGFDLDLQATGTDLAVGLAQVDASLAGTSRVRVQAVRDSTGLTLRRASAQTGAGRLEASGTVATGASDLKLAVDVTDVARFVPDLSGPGRLTGTARQVGGNWTVETQAQGPGGIRAQLAGQLGAQFQTAALTLTGTVPLALANPRLVPNSVQGFAELDLRLDGPLALSSLRGTVQTADTRLSIPAIRNALTGLQARITLDGAQAQLAAQAAVDSGGQITAAGRMALDAPRVTDITVQLTDVVLRDPKLYDTTTNGTLRLSGTAPGGLALVGRLVQGVTEIRVPASGSGAGGDIPEIAHINEPAAVRRTRDLAGLIVAPKVAGSAAPFALGLDVLVVADSRIFVRGRGLDAELGGQVRLTGSTVDMRPQGRFDLIRGRLDILGKRLALVEGYAQLEDGVIPTLRLVARTTSDDTVIDVVLEGPADAPEIRFESTPQLPEDEVLAQLLFGRGIAGISAFQAVQLASAVATLSGRGGVGLIERLRQSTGFDDLDVASDGAGGTSVRAGKYISENAYTNVELDSSGQSRVTLNLDLAPSTTLRGQVGSDGSTGLGLFFERDY